MLNKNNVKSEFELYKPMCAWLEQYLSDKYKNYNIFTIDAHNERLDRVLGKLGIVNDLAIGVDIQTERECDYPGGYKAFSRMEAFVKCTGEGIAHGRKKYEDTNCKFDEYVTNEFDFKDKLIYKITIVFKS